MIHKKLHICLQYYKLDIKHEHDITARITTQGVELCHVLKHQHRDVPLIKPNIYRLYKPLVLCEDLWLLVSPVFSSHARWYIKSVQLDLI